MTRYQNGRIPDSALATIAEGVNGDGFWKHQLSAGMLHKWLTLVALAKARTRRTLTITTGWCAYRPLPAQRLAKARYGPMAAAVGYSSHGGTFQGRDALAIDVANWQWVYGYDREAFFEDCREAGFDPGVISNEPWHIIDRDPWAKPPATVASLTGGNLAPAEPEQLEEEMTISYINVKGEEGKRRGGCYAVMRANNGKLFARFVSAKAADGIPVVEGARELAEWDQTFKGMPGLS